MAEMDRREFLKTVAIGGAVLGLGNAVLAKPLKALASGKYDIGECKSVHITCISELGWHDNGKFLMPILKSPKKGLTNQWTIPFDPENAAGSCTLIDVETLSGGHHKFLLDTGWNVRYMKKCYKRENVDKMLKKGDIEFLVISHEHLDHYWGLEATLRYNPEIKIYIPDTFKPEGMHFLKGAEFMAAHVRNGIPHQGELVKTKIGEVNKLFDGCGLVAFDTPCGIQVEGEESLYFNVKNKGIVCVTGCCHQGILTFADFARKNLVGGDRMHAVYGGLHLAPFGSILAERKHHIDGMKQYNFDKVACNHCTGLKAVERMVELGYPVMKGTGKHGSISDLYIGNGDKISFG